MGGGEGWGKGRRLKERVGGVIEKGRCWGRGVGGRCLRTPGKTWRGGGGRKTDATWPCPGRDGTFSPLIHTSGPFSMSGQVWGPQGEQQQPPRSMTDFQPGAGGDGGGAKALSRLPQWVTPPLRHTAWFFPLPGNPSKKESPSRGLSL